MDLLGAKQMFEVHFISTTLMIEPLSNKEIIQVLYCCQVVFTLQAQGKHSSEKFACFVLAFSVIFQEFCHTTCEAV